MNDTAAPEKIEAFDVVDLIRTKRDGGELATDEIDWLIDAYTRRYVADEQMSALAMAILIRGMGRREIRDMTLAMIASGERMDFSGLGKRTVDKHSTGGWATRSRCHSCPSWRPSASPFRSCPDAGSGTRVERSTSSSRSPAGAPSSPTSRCSPNCATSEASSARPAAASRRRTSASTPSATSRGPSRPSRSSRRASCRRRSPRAPRRSSST